VDSRNEERPYLRKASFVPVAESPTSSARVEQSRAQERSSGSGNVLESQKKGGGMNGGGGNVDNSVLYAPGSDNDETPPSQRAPLMVRIERGGGRVTGGVTMYLTSGKTSEECGTKGRRGLRFASLLVVCPWENLLWKRGS